MYLTGPPIQFIYTRHTVYISFIVSTQQKSSLPPKNDPPILFDSFPFQETRGSEPEFCSRCRYHQDRAWCGSTTTQLHILQVMSGAIILRICCHSRKPQNTLPVLLIFALVAFTILVQWNSGRSWSILKASLHQKAMLTGNMRLLCIPTQPRCAVHAPGQAKLDKHTCPCMSTRQLHCAVI